MNTLLVGLTQEEEKKLLEALGGFPDFKVVFRCDSYRQALEICSNHDVDFMFISVRVNDMSYRQFAQKRKDTGWTAFLVGRGASQSNLNLLATEGYSAGRMAGFVSINLLDRDIPYLLNNIRV